jgi:flagellar motor switch protein FliN
VSATLGGAEPTGDWRAQCKEVCTQAAACLLRRLEDTAGAQASLDAGAFETENAEGGSFILHELAEVNGSPLHVRFGMTLRHVRAEIAPPATIPKHSASLDLLMEVELPVSVSFGRTQMRLKDAVRLSTGSIVELNKSLSEPVEIIVNNCVIARGEVVVVEGNYGVRIKEIVSREERLRTLF